LFKTDNTNETDIAKLKCVKVNIFKIF